MLHILRCKTCESRLAWWEQRPVAWPVARRNDFITHPGSATVPKHCRGDSDCTAGCSRERFTSHLFLKTWLSLKKWVWRKVHKGASRWLKCKVNRRLVLEDLMHKQAAGHVPNVFLTLSAKIAGLAYTFDQARMKTQPEILLTALLMHFAKFTFLLTVLFGLHYCHQKPNGRFGLVAAMGAETEDRQKKAYSAALKPAPFTHENDPQLCKRLMI